MLSLVALQNIFELGFSFVVLQTAAHESVHFEIDKHPKERAAREEVARERLASLLKMIVKWYSIAAIVMGATLLPLGILFFSRNSQAQIVSWRSPWIAAVLATASLFFINPFLSFLEGCGQVREVALMRLGQGVAAIVVPWSVLLSGHGLYAPAAVNASYCTVGIIFLGVRRHSLLPFIIHPGNGNRISWRNEIWPFQWKIAVSFLCSYLTIQVFTPILFAYCGAVTAGRMGMSMSVTGYLWAVVFSWMSTKATPFGKLVSSRQFAELDCLFVRTLRQSLVVLAAAVLLVMTVLSLVQREYPPFASRMLPFNQLALMLFTAISTFLVQSVAIYLRAHRFEPFLWQSIGIAALTCALAFAVVPIWGVQGAVLTYVFSMGIVAPTSALVIFKRKRTIRTTICECQA